MRCASHRNSLRGWGCLMQSQLPTVPCLTPGDFLALGSGSSTLQFIPAASSSQHIHLPPLTSSLQCLGHAPGHRNCASHLPQGVLLGIAELSRTTWSSQPFPLTPKFRGNEGKHWESCAAMKLSRSSCCLLASQDAESWDLCCAVEMVE